MMKFAASNGSVGSTPGLSTLTRFVCSIPNRSTSGVLMIPGGKVPPSPTGATYPGPWIVSIVLLGSACISRCVTVLWLMWLTVREVRIA